MLRLSNAFGKKVQRFKGSRVAESCLQANNGLSRANGVHADAYAGGRLAASPIQPQPLVLFTPAFCEAVAAERAARMGATLRRGSKTAQGRTKHLVRKRPKGEHWRRERVRGNAPASAGARNVRERLPTHIFPCAPRQGGARGGSRSRLPLRAAVRSVAVGSNGGVCFGLVPKAH